MTGTIQPYVNNAPLAPVVPDHEAWTRVYQPLIDLAGRLSNSPFVPDKMRGDTGAVFSVILAGHGLGLSPVQALQSIVLISGKPYISTEVILGLALRAGHSVHWGECTDRKATVRIQRGDGRGSAEVTYTMAQAELAGLKGKDNWRRMPGEMLRARAVRSALKMCAPDLALGLETAENPTVGLTEEPAGTGATVVQLAAPPVPDVPSSAPSAEESTVLPQPERQDDVLPPPTPVTSAQLRKINAQLGEYERLAGKLGRDGRRDMIRRLLLLETLDSAKELTVDQGREVIEALDIVIAEQVEAQTVEDAEVVDETGQEPLS